MAILGKSVGPFIDIALNLGSEEQQDEKQSAITT